MKDMEMAWTFLFTCLLIDVQVTTGVSTHEDKEFVISTPSLIPRETIPWFPQLIITLQSQFNSTVRVVTQHQTNREAFIDKTFRLDAMVPKVQAELSLVYKSDSSSGYRWTYHFVGSKKFTVMVQVVMTPTISETFQPIPVSGWGNEYYLFTLESQASVVFMTNEARNMIMFTLSSKVDNMTLAIFDAELPGGFSTNILLLPYQSYSLSTCNHPESKISLTGSKVTGEHSFGVIAGNCMSATNFQNCASYSDSEESASPVVEMFFPLKTYGRLFILFKTSGRATPGYYVIMAPDKPAQVKMFVNYQGGSEQMEMFNLDPGEWKVKESNYRWMISSSGLQVIYVQSSSCIPTSGKDGAPSMVVIVPVELFYNVYIVMTPLADMKHYVLLVVPVALAHTIKTIYTNITNGNPLISRLATENNEPLLMGPPFRAWQIYEFETKKQTTFTLYSLKTSFGCYVHGRSEVSTYIHTGGFISSNINERGCVQSLTPLVDGDHKDNDCDGFVDEEINDGTDDDTYSTDTLTDEDTAITYSDNSTFDDYLGYHMTDVFESKVDFPENAASASPSEPGETFTFPPQPPMDEPPVIKFGTLTMWREWICTRNCSVSDLMRKRDCIPSRAGKGCNAPLVEYKHSNCNVEKCPEGCAPQYFGQKCLYKCVQCMTECEKFYGSCPICYPGYDYAETGCQLDRRGYKDWTRWECTENCSNPYLVRKRMCKEGGTCMQPIVDIKPGLCHIGKCFKHCAPYKWGDNCSGSCANCEQPCNKMSGACDSCKPGFQKPESACQTPCKHYSYGVNCSGSCIEKCNEDCIERTTGECRASLINNTYLMFAILTVPVCIFVYFVVKRKKEEEEIAAARSMISLRSGASKSKQSLVSLSRSQQSLKSSRSKGSLHQMKSKSQTSLKVAHSVEV